MESFHTHILPEGYSEGTFRFTNGSGAQSGEQTFGCAKISKKTQWHWSARCCGSSKLQGSLFPLQMHPHQDVSPSFTERRCGPGPFLGPSLPHSARNINGLTTSLLTRRLCSLSAPKFMLLSVENFATRNFLAALAPKELSMST